MEQRGTHILHPRDKQYVLQRLSGAQPVGPIVAQGGEHSDRPSCGGPLGSAGSTGPSLWHRSPDTRDHGYAPRRLQRVLSIGWSHTRRLRGHNGTCASKEVRDALDDGEAVEVAP
jgi:hypothetical protein